MHGERCKPSGAVKTDEWLSTFVYRIGKVSGFLPESGGEIKGFQIQRKFVSW